MTSPTTKLTVTHDLISVALIIIAALSIKVNANSDYCKDRKFANTFNTTYMQFTKETVSEEYAIEGEFKNLHCCAKGYRSIEWLKDGKRYPWSSEDISSLILYPQAANQTIYARHASKVDEGTYTCVLRNDTHKIEHQMQLKVLESSPDVPLATFTPVSQFADVGGSARFFCEAFVGKKDLPDISISIRWYHVFDDNQDHPIVDELQEIVEREEEQIIGSYLTIPQVAMNSYGRYLCRVEMGNSRTHRLEMSAELINALPVEAENNSIFLNPYFLASCAAVITISLFFLLLRSQQCWGKHINTLSSIQLELEVLNMKFPDSPPAVSSVKKSKPQRKRNSSHDDTRIMIDVI